MNAWDVHYWNKHEYRWIYVVMVYGDSAQIAIRNAKNLLPDFVNRGDVMKVEKC